MSLFSCSCKFCKNRKTRTRVLDIKHNKKLTTKYFALQRYLEQESALLCIVSKRGLFKHQKLNLHWIEQPIWLKLTTFLELPKSAIVDANFDHAIVKGTFILYARQDCEVQELSKIEINCISCLAKLDKGKNPRTRPHPCSYTTLVQTFYLWFIFMLVCLYCIWDTINLVISVSIKSLANLCQAL